jgi:phospho-N-acetylmuramoyl-pentapeptide-transferase
MEETYVIKIFVITTLSFLVALFWMPSLLNILRKNKIGKKIRDEETTPIFSKLHKKKEGTPTMGGILIWGTVLILSLLFYLLQDVFKSFNLFKNLNFLTQKETLLPIGALVASAVVGLFDDLFNVMKIGAKGGGLRVRHRLIIYTLIATVGAWWFYYKLDWDIIHVPFMGNFEIGLWYLPVFIFIIVATSHSVNLTDGLDGLAGGTLLISFAAYGAIAFAQGRYDLSAFCGAIIGALVAFLWFNINPAKFFMGDTGSMSLGVTLGIVAMLTNYALLLPVIGFVFVLETGSVLTQITSKKLFRKKVFLSSPLHHHLEAKGWPEATIVMRFWLLSGISAVVGLILFFLDKA